MGTASTDGAGAGAGAGGGAGAGSGAGAGAARSGNSGCGSVGAAATTAGASGGTSVGGEGAGTFVRATALAGRGRAGGTGGTAGLAAGRRATGGSMATRCGGGATGGATGGAGAARAGTSTTRSVGTSTRRSCHGITSPGSPNGSPPKVMLNSSAWHSNETSSAIASGRRSRPGSRTGPGRRRVARLGGGAFGPLAFAGPGAATRGSFEFRIWAIAPILADPGGVPAKRQRVTPLWGAGLAPCGHSCARQPKTCVS